MKREDKFPGDPVLSDLNWITFKPDGDLGTRSALLGILPESALLRFPSRRQALREVLIEVVRRAYESLRNSEGDLIVAGHVMAAGVLLGIVRQPPDRDGHRKPLLELMEGRLHKLKKPRQVTAAFWISEQGITSDSALRKLQDECLEDFREAIVEFLEDGEAVATLVERVLGRQASPVTTDAPRGATQEPLAQPVQMQMQPSRLTPPAPKRTPNDRFDNAVQQLADRIRARLQAEQRHWELNIPSPPLPLRWTNAPEQFVDHWQVIRPDGLSAAIDLSGTGNDLCGTFAAVPSRRLVVLGEAGAGKSVMLMRFALALLADQLGATNGLVPLPLRLASWSPAQREFQEWLVDSLAAELPGRIRGRNRTELAHQLLVYGRILPVLDGFDELAPELREWALDEISAGLNREDGFVLTSRPDAYIQSVKAEFRERRKVLPGTAVVQLQPLLPEDVATYLHGTAAKHVTDGHVTSKWGPVLDAMRADRSPKAQALAEALSTPLMVEMARAAYSDTDAEPDELLNNARLQTSVDFAERLLDEFVAVAYRRPAADESGKPIPRKWSRTKAENYLERIALLVQRSVHAPEFAWWSLGRRTETDFRLSWAPWLVSWLGFALLASGRPSMPRLVLHCICWLFICFLLMPLHDHELLKTEWRLPGTLRVVHAMSRERLRVPALLDVLAFLSIGIVTFALASRWFTGMIFLALAAQMMIVLEGIEIATPIPFQPSSRPFGLLATRRRETLIAAGVFLVAVWAAGTFASSMAQGRFSPSLQWFFISADIMLVPVFASTWGQWLIARVWLALTGQLPWRTVRFIRDAYERGLLRQSGSVYEFRHALLANRLAARALSGMSKAEKSRLPVLYARNNLAARWKALGNREAAFREFRSAFLDGMDKYGSKEYITAVLGVNTIDTDYDGSREFDPDEAIGHLRGVLISGFRVLSVDRGFTLRCWTRLIIVLEEAGYIAEAREELARLEALTGRNRPSGERTFLISRLEGLAVFDEVRHRFGDAMTTDGTVSPD